MTGGRAVALTLALWAAAAAPAGAEDAAAGAPIACWDQSFAYTVIGLRRDGSDMQVRLSTQNEPILAPLVPEADLDWGLARFDIRFPPDACLADPGRKVFVCRGNGLSAALEAGRTVRGDVVRVETVWETIAVELMRVERAADGETDGIQMLLVITGRAGGQVRTFVEHFPHGADCSGWPDPFAER